MQFLNVFLISFHTFQAVQKSASHVGIPDSEGPHTVKLWNRTGETVQEEILNAVNGGIRQASFSGIMIIFYTDRFHMFIQIILVYMVLAGNTDCFSNLVWSNEY